MVKRMVKVGTIGSNFKQNVRVLVTLLIGALFLSSCVSVRKAKAVLDDHPQEAADYCATRFPVKDSIVVTVIPPDTELIRKAIDSAVQVHDSLCSEYADEVNKLLLYKQEQLSELQKNDLDKKLDSLKRDYNTKVRKEAERLYQSLPPKEIKTVEYKENTAKVEFWRLEAEKQQKNFENQKAKSDRWKRIAIVFICITIILTLYTFRKPIIKVIQRVIGISFTIPPV
jgi:PBP1b-binding outer membrane lipoprotein LpoB